MDNEIPINGIEVNAEGVFKNTNEYGKCDQCGAYTEHRMILCDNGREKPVHRCRSCIDRYYRKQEEERIALQRWMNRSYVL